MTLNNQITKAFLGLILGFPLITTGETLKLGTGNLKEKTPITLPQSNALKLKGEKVTPQTSTAKAIQKVAGTNSGGGGAGCIGTDGSTITFYNCGVYKEPVVNPDAPAEPSLIDGPSEQPEGLAELIQFFETFPYLNAGDKSVILAALRPTIYRKYFSTVPADINSTTENRILFQFKRAVGKDPSQLRLFGVTDTSAKISYMEKKAQITYLLPGFHKLKTIEEKQAALFHEAFWVIYPDANDEVDAVRSEMALQAVLNRPTDTKRIFELVSILENIQYSKNHPAGHTREYIKLAFKLDIESGALNGLVNEKNQISSEVFFNAESLECYSQWIAQNPYGEGLSKESLAKQTCNLIYINYLNSMRRQYKNSVILALAGKAAINLNNYKALTFENLYNELQGGREKKNKLVDTLFPSVGKFKIRSIKQTPTLIQINTGADDLLPMSLPGKSAKKKGGQ